MAPATGDGTPRGGLPATHYEGVQMMADGVSQLNELATSGGRDVAVFDPKATATKDAKLDAVIEYARRVKDWETLEAAVDQKVEQIREFVGWWGDAVSVGQSPGRGNKTVAERGLFSADQAEDMTGISKQQVSRWRSKLKDEESYKETLYGAAYRKMMSEAADNHLAMGSGENEWYTPPEYIEMARDVMGSIDLDPATCHEANETVKAEQIFTAEDNGLAQKWEGNVWLNPPYSRDLMPAFVGKLCDSYTDGEVEQAVLVSHNNTDTQWFQRLAKTASAICFPARRIRFYRGEDVAAPVNGQAFFYLGESPERFAEVYGAIGVVLRPMP
jgi:hypothetical protein